MRYDEDIQTPKQTNRGYHFIIINIDEKTIFKIH